MIYYIFPNYIRSECYEFNKGLFKFICGEGISIDDFDEYLKQYPDRAEITHLIYYLSQYTQDDSNNFDEWYQYVSNQIDVIAKLCNHTFANDNERKLVSLAISIKTIDQSKYNILELKQYFTDWYCNYALNTKFESRDDKIYCLYIVTCKITDYFSSIKNKDNKVFIKMIKLRNTLSPLFDDIDSKQYKIIHGEDKDE